MDGLENESVWDTSVASLTPVSNATVTTPADHENYNPGQYLDLHLSGSSTPAVDPAYSKMEYDLVISHTNNGKALGGTVTATTTAAMLDIQYGTEHAPAPTDADDSRAAYFNNIRADFSLLSNLRVPNPAGAITLFDDVTTRTDTGVVIEETQRLDIVNEMKHYYCKDPIAKFNDSLFTASSVDSNEWGLAKHSFRPSYQPPRSGIDDSAIMKGLLDPSSSVCKLESTRNASIQGAWAGKVCTYDEGTVAAGSLNGQVVPKLKFTAAPGAQLEPYLQVAGNILEVWKLTSSTAPAPAHNEFVGYCAVGSFSGTTLHIVTKGRVNGQLFGPFPEGFDKGLSHISPDNGVLKKNGGGSTYEYALRPLQNISYNITIPVTHEIPSALFMYPQGKTVYVNQLGGLRMRWHLTDPEHWFRRHEQHGWDTTSSDKPTYALNQVRFRFRTVTPSLDMEQAMQEAIESSDGTFFDIVSYTHVAQAIPQGVTDFPINLPSFTQRRAFSLFAIPEYNQTEDLHCIKFPGGPAGKPGGILKVPIDTANPQHLTWRLATKTPKDGFKAWQWQLWGRQQPSQEVDVQALSKCPQGMLLAGGVSAQEQAKAFANIGLPVKDLRNQNALFVIPRRLSAQGGFADLSGDQPANPVLRVKFTKGTPEPFVMHCFCAHQKRVTISAGAGVIVSE